MTCFPSEDNVQAMGCALFTNASLHRSLAALIAGHPDGIPMIIEAMKRFPDVSDLQGYGCMALFNITNHKNFAHYDKIVQADGLIVLAAAKTKHPNNERI